MSQLPAPNIKPKLQASLFDRLRWAVRAFMAPSTTPQIMIGDAVLDLEQGILSVPGDFTIHTTGDLKFKSDQHVVIESGQSHEERPGYLHSIWLNPEYDDQGRPVQTPEVLEGEITDAEQI